MDHYFVKEWRKARGLTQGDLAKAADTTDASISRIERNKQGLTGERLALIAGALDIAPGAIFRPPPEGTHPLRDDEAGQAGSIAVPKPPPRPDRAEGPARAEGMVQTGLVSDRADLPIYASAQGGSTGMTLTFDPIDWVKRPEPLFNVRAGFGMYVVGDSMEPAYRQGDMILVHPNRPANAGDDVLVVKSDGNGHHEALVKTLVSTDDRQIRMKQYNPPEEFALDRDGIHGVYLIVGKYHRR
jgi:transcriptional regulator with XRE-family HTH domain